MPNGNVFTNELKKWQDKLTSLSKQYETTNQNLAKSQGIAQSGAAEGSVPWWANVLKGSFLPGIGAEQMRQAIPEKAKEWYPITPMERLVNQPRNEAISAYYHAQGVGTPEEEIEALNTVTRDLGRAKWFADFYSVMPNLVALGQVSSIEDYTKLMTSGEGILMEEDVAQARQAISDLSAEKISRGTPREGQPTFLEVEPGKEAEIREFLTAGQETLLTPISLDQLSVDEVLKALKTTAVPTLEGMTPEEALELMKVMGVTEEQAKTAGEYLNIVKNYSDQAKKAEEEIKNVLAGTSEWKMPDMSFAERAKFFMLSPMQVVADVMKPYIENVSYPLAGLATVMTQRIISGEQDTEAEFDRIRASGKNFWSAAGTAWEKWDAPWWQKLPIEIITDPLTYLPGVALSVPGKIAVKVGLKTFGLRLLALNKGLYAALDIPFDLVKAGMARIPKSFAQATRAELDILKDLTLVNTAKRTGKLITHLSVDDISKTLDEAIVAFKNNPMAQADTMVDLGRKLTEVTPVGKKDAVIWAKSVGGKLEEATADINVITDINDIIRDTVVKVGSPAENAKRLAAALLAEDTPEIIGKLQKDIQRYVRRYSVNIEAAKAVGKAAKISPIPQMMSSLEGSYRKIVQGVVQSEYADGKALHGIVLGLQRHVDAIENNAWRMTLDRYLIKPMAEAYLGSVAYPIWNALEGIFVSTVEGIVPRATKQEAFLRMFQGLLGTDPRLLEWSASDIVGMLGEMPGRKGARFGRGIITGAPPISFLPGKVPESLGTLFGKEIMTPKWIAGKDWFEWTGRKWIELSDTWGTSYRANFLMRKMANYLAEDAYKVMGQDINAAFKKLIGKPPAISSTRLNIKDEDLIQMVFEAMSTGRKKEVQALKEIFSNGSLMQGEQLKIVRQATLLSQQARTLAEQAIFDNKVMGTADTISDLCKTIADQTVADIADSAKKLPETYTYLAGMIGQQEVKSAEDLMQVTQHYLVMAENASNFPSTVLARTFEEADQLRQLGKFKQIEQLWTSSRGELQRAIDTIDNNMELVRQKVLANTKFLKPEQEQALMGLLERHSARDALKTGFMEADGKMLDEFFALPRKQRSPEMYTALRERRAEEYARFRKDDAVIGASDFLARKDFSKLYYNLPEQRLSPVNASARALSHQDIANVMGCNVDALSTGIAESTAMQSRDHFVQVIKQHADSRPDLFKGFTEEKISQAYDSILQSMKFDPAVDIARQEVLQQVEGIKQRLTNLRMLKSLTPDEEKAVHGWMDGIAGGMDDIFQAAPKKGKPSTPEEALASGKYLVRGDSPAEPGANIGGGTWATNNLEYAKAYGKKLSFMSRPKNPLVVDDIAEAWERYNIPHSDKMFEELKKAIQAEGYDALEFRSPMAKDAAEIWIFEQPKLLSLNELPSMEKVGAEITLTPIKSNIGKGYDITVGGKRVGSVTYGEFGTDPRFVNVLGEDMLILGRVDVKATARRQGAASKALDAILGEAETAGKPLYSGMLEPDGKSWLEGLEKSGIIKLEKAKQEMFGFKISRGTAQFPSAKPKGMIPLAEWDKVRQEASRKAHVDYYKAYADYTNQNILDAAGKMIYPYWTYHMYRWFFLPRTFVRHPGIAAAWGKYNDYSEYGYVHIPGTDLDLNPFVGSAFGATFGLARHDFKSYFSNLGIMGEVLDFTQRRGFFPGVHFMLPVVLSPIFSGRPPELGEALPPGYRAGLEMFIGSNIPVVRDAATWLRDKLFHENFRDYYTATIASGMQVKAGGELIDGQSGVDLWFKIQRGEKLTLEEQDIWDEASRRTAWYTVLRSQFPIFRLQEEEYTEAQDKITAIFEAQYGMTKEFQEELWKHNLKPTDIIGGLPLYMKLKMDEMWQWKMYLGRGAILMPPEISDLYNRINEYWNRVRTFQKTRMEVSEAGRYLSQTDIDKGFLTPSSTLHFDGGEWRSQYANSWQNYTSMVEALKTDPRFAEVMIAITPEGQVELAKKLGYSAPSRSPMDEAIDLYFSLELKKTKDKYTGEEDWDYLGFWLNREAVRMALTPEQRKDFEAYIRKYETPVEKLYRQVSDKYIRGYKAVPRIVLAGYSEEQKALIAEYYSDTVALDRKAAIREMIAPSGRKLISDWEGGLSEARSRLRLVSPMLDFWLYAFGYTTTVKTPAAQALASKFDANRSVILEYLKE
jgi:hypothetical protein